MMKITEIPLDSRFPRLVRADLTQAPAVLRTPAVESMTNKHQFGNCQIITEAGINMYKPAESLSSWLELFSH